jgi:hypothetical protein
MTFCCSGVSVAIFVLLSGLKLPGSGWTEVPHHRF